MRASNVCKKTHTSAYMLMGIVLAVCMAMCSFGQVAYADNSQRIEETTYGVKHPKVKLNAYFQLLTERGSTSALSGWTNQPVIYSQNPKFNDLDGTANPALHAPGRNNPEARGFHDGSEEDKISQSVDYGQHYSYGPDRMLLPGRYSIEVLDWDEGHRQTTGQLPYTYWISAISASIEDATDSGNFEYKVKMSDGSESNWAENGITVGNLGSSKAVVGVAFRLTGDLAKHYDLVYNVSKRGYVNDPMYSTYSSMNGAWNPASQNGNPYTAQADEMYQQHDGKTFDIELPIDQEQGSVEPGDAIYAIVFNITPKSFKVHYIDDFTGGEIATERVNYGEAATYWPDKPVHGNYVAEDWTGPLVHGEGGVNGGNYVKEDVYIHVAYHPQSTSYSPAVTKTLSGEGPWALPAGGFSFALKDENGNVLQEKSNDGSGIVSFDSINYTETGTYTYKIAETTAASDGYITDTHVETLTVKVTDDNGQLKASATYSNSGKFANTVRQGKVTVQKDDSDLTTNQGDGSLVKAVFTIYRDRACTLPTGVSVTIGNERVGSATSQLISPLGNPYYIKETTAPEKGYLVNGNVYEVWAEAVW